MWERMLHSLSHRGISPEAYLKVVGRPESELLAELEPDAERGLRREAVITAIVEAEGISPSDEEVLAVLAPTAEREGVKPETLFGDLRAAGRLEEVREDLAARQAIDLLAESAKPIPVAQAQAREALWTPEKAEQESGEEGAGDAGSRLWTPGR
jgi:trigger factor